MTRVGTLVHTRPYHHMFLASAEARQRLQCRCAAARHWVALWRQGKGKPVDRSALEQSGAVTSAFIDKATDLATALEGSGQALIDALRNGRLLRFRTDKIDSLEQWLTDESYIDNQPSLSADERRRSTLQQVMPQSDAQDINRLVDWLEAALVEETR